MDAQFSTAKLPVYKEVVKTGSLGTPIQYSAGKMSIITREPKEGIY